MAQSLLKNKKLLDIKITLLNKIYKESVNHDNENKINSIFSINKTT